VKISVTRQAKITRGATRSETAKEYVIGFEGSGSTSDQLIEIRTEWLDANGSALPEDLPGFTGRLAMTASALDDSTAEQIALPDGGMVQMQSPCVAKSATGTAPNPTNEDRTGFFPIRPGKRPVVVRLPDGSNVDRNHFYVHVDAQPLTRNVDFTGRPAPAGPSFSVKQVC